MTDPIPTKILDSIAPSTASARSVAKELRGLLANGATLVAGGRALEEPSTILRGAFVPRHVLDLTPFGYRVFLTDSFQNPDLRFVVAYVLPLGAKKIYARIFYKDTSLVWRAASHLVKTADEFWIGKGDLVIVAEGDMESVFSRESTTDLPLELLPALEAIAQGKKAAPTNDRILEKVLRRAPSSRLEPYADFTAPRRRAARDPRNLINEGREVATFRKKNDPTSLRFVRGFEPDLSRGVIESGEFESFYYGGIVQRFRVLSKNRQIQYAFMAAPRQAWLLPPQALTTELSTFAVRTVDVEIDEDAIVPGYEFHFLEKTEDGESLHSQIPPGFAGPHHPNDDDRATTAPWTEQLPIIRAFREKVLQRP